MSVCPHRKWLLFVVSFCLIATPLCSAPQSQEETSTEKNSTGKTDASPVRFFSPGALLFGDVYTVPDHHLPEADAQTGAWIRRIYLTGDFNFSKRIFARVRLEANQDGDFVSKDLTADIKDLFLRLAVGRHKLFFGLAPTPTFDQVETLWGYRHLEKTPLDLQGVPSRDWGIAAHGPLTDTGFISYRIMIGTGDDIGKETGEGRKYMGAVSFGDSDKGLLVGLYGDFQKLPGATDRTTGQIHFHYSLGRAGIGGLYAYQDREEDPRLEVLSVYGRTQVSSKVTLVGRLDRLLAPSPRGDGIDYLPFDPGSKATLLVAGFEWRPCPYFSLIPNVESIVYDQEDRGEKPPNDVLLRLTFYIHN